MHPTAILLVFVTLILLIITGVILASLGGWRLRKQWQERPAGKKLLVTSSLTLLFGVFLVLYNARGLFRIVWEG